MKWNVSLSRLPLSLLIFDEPVCSSALHRNTAMIKAANDANSLRPNDRSCSTLPNPSDVQQLPTAVTPEYEKKKKKSETQPNSRAKSRRYSPVFESVRIGSGVLVSGELCRIQWVLITSTCWSLQVLILCQMCLVFNLSPVCVLIHLVTWNTWLWHFV